MKLAALGRYLKAYTTALKDQPFTLTYIDAFAGTGYRSNRRPTESDSAGQLEVEFEDLAAPEPAQLRDGSAKIALDTKPGFNRFIFLEKSPARCVRLEGLKDEFPRHVGAVEILKGDANPLLRELCRRENWDSQRAVLFLDPYGMQVEWPTLQAIAQTRAIDVWLLFPLGIGVNRLLTRSGDIPQAWRRRLDTLLGTTDWYEEFYAVEPVRRLFGDDENIVVKRSTEVIGRYFIHRLRTIFPGVAENPIVLANSRNCPLYLLCFAMSNSGERAKQVALRIANHIIGSKGWR